MFTVRPLTEETLQSAMSVVESRFGSGGINALRIDMANPIRREFPVAGHIVFKDETPVAFEASILRRMFFRGEPFLGRVGGLSCRRKNAPLRAFLFALAEVEAFVENLPHGRRLSFGNSLCRETAATACLNDSCGRVPMSCSTVLERRIRRIPWLMLRLRYWLQRVRRKLFKIGLAEKEWPEFSTLHSSGYEVQREGLRVKRLMEFRTDLFDGLMARYLETNTGLVSSRTAEELEWLFGERVRNGRAVLLGAFEKGEHVGYVIVDGGVASRHWRIVDWFALRNDVLTLEALLKTACCFLKSETPAITLSCEGFPTFVQPLISKYLPHRTTRPYSVFSWTCGKDAAFQAELEKIIDTPQSWFFSPYDGDACY